MVDTWGIRNGVYNKSSQDSVKLNVFNPNNDDYTYG